MLNFLKFARRKQAFGRVATIGRQEINVPIDKLKSALNLKGYTKYGPYCEELLIGHFAATVVESFDNSDYEHATHMADMNKPLAVQNRYDTVIDGGASSTSITFLKHCGMYRKSVRPGDKYCTYCRQTIFAVTDSGKSLQSYFSHYIRRPMATGKRRCSWPIWRTSNSGIRSERHATASAQM
jgi:hypothetical protein